MHWEKLGLTDSSSGSLWREVAIPSLGQLYLEHISAESHADCTYTTFLYIFHLPMN